MPKIRRTGECALCSRSILVENIGARCISRLCPMAHPEGEGSAPAASPEPPPVIADVPEPEAAAEPSPLTVESAAPTSKPSNPKDVVGIRKAPMSTVSAPVIAELGVAMLEGAAKYGRHNYRAVGVRASVYYDATMRHLMRWWEGEDNDPDSGLSHVTKAIASLAVLRDATLQGKLQDDRPPSSPNLWPALDHAAGQILDRHADKNPHHYTIADGVQQ